MLGGFDGDFADIFTGALRSRIYELELSLGNLKEYSEIANELAGHYYEIKKLLPDDKKLLTVKVDDCFAKILSLCEKYYYTKGFNDALVLKRVTDSQTSMLSML